MGMTIDKAIDRLEDLHFEQDDWEYGELTDDCLLNREALRLAIDTMHKYQKIQEILKWNNAPSPYYKPDGQLFREICKVIEDGSNDC